MEFIECVAFLIPRNSKVLAEKRSLSKKFIPGLVVIPGGHVEKGESFEEAMNRELSEELNLVSEDFSYLCSLLDESDEGLLRMHYFVIHKYTGSMECNEAEKLKWLDVTDPKELDLEVDKVAIKEYRRLFEKQED